MAKTYNNIFVHWLREATSEPVGSYKTRSGQTILTGKPMFDDNRQLTQTQKTQQAALREAANYANFYRTQKIYVNKEKKTGTPAYSLAITDWLCMPKVLEINVDGWTGEIGQTIRVKAKDNVMVVRVEVILRDAENHVLETGEAEQSRAGSSWWHYTTKTRMIMKPFPTVEAVAYDLPGNRNSFIIS